ncbi:restriction endonuclease [Halogeometricum borinquense]|uniref:Restriction endonuclease n=1 Tax=Halogeometricum borinquense TaxID=60847 RepID=A0A6C0UFW8_9EURY|nr:restriction endonuclease [Halogeometricum borinquense]
MPLVSKQRIQGMDNEEFEHFVADLYERMGWDCTVTDYAQDQGIDIIATKSVPYSQKKLIQAKRYSDSNPVSGPDVQQYASLKQQEQDVDSVIIVTTGRFTQSAIDLAENLNVKLVNRLGVKPRGFPWVSRTLPRYHRSDNLERRRGSRSGRPQPPMPAVSKSLRDFAGCTRAELL